MSYREKTKILIDALKRGHVSIKGKPTLDYSRFSFHNDVSHPDGEICFRPTYIGDSSKEGTQNRGQNISIAYDDIEKGHLDKTGFFTCVNGDGHEMGITCDHLVEITFSGDESSQVYPEYAALKPLFDTLTGDYEVLSRVHHEALADPSP